MKLEVIHLRTGWFVSPKNSCGTCGWSPKPWQMVRVDMRSKNPIRDFLNLNKEFSIEDIESVEWETCVSSM